MILRKPTMKQLARALSRYTNKSSPTYDFKFDKKIKEIRPDWFSSVASKHKIRLLEMAKNGESRPLPKTLLSNALCSYRCSGHVSYDYNFSITIGGLRPDWFENSADVKKRKLLKLAKSGGDRPYWGSSLVIALSSYLQKGKLSYDETFDKEIRKLRPDWFADTAKENKKKLLKMAENKERRPSATKHPLAKALVRYTNKKNKGYDPVFDKKNRKLRPDWFINVANQRKEQLLEMAINNEPRPLKNRDPMKRHPLAVFLISYTGKTSNAYDPVFDKKIRELRPDWFKKAKSR